MKQNFKDRPRLKTNLGKTTLAIAFASGIFLLACVLAVFWFYPSLPPLLEAHWNHQDGAFAYKEDIWLLVAIASGLSVGLSVLIPKPYFLNYPVPVTKYNAESLYRHGTKLICNVKISSDIFFGILLLDFVCRARQMAALPVFTLSLLYTAYVVVIAIYFVSRMYKSNT